MNFNFKPVQQKELKNIRAAKKQETSIPAIEKIESAVLKGFKYLVHKPVRVQRNEIHFRSDFLMFLDSIPIVKTKVLFKASEDVKSC